MSGPRPDASCEQLILSRSPERRRAERGARKGERGYTGQETLGPSLERDRNLGDEILRPNALLGGNSRDACASKTRKSKSER